jgi:Protein of unknown function (DUF3108)
MFAPPHDAPRRRVASLRALLLIALAVALAHAVFLRHARLQAPGADRQARPAVTVLHWPAPNGVPPVPLNAVAAAPATKPDSAAQRAPPVAARKAARESERLDAATATPAHRLTTGSDDDTASRAGADTSSADQPAGMVLDAAPPASTPVYPTTTPPPFTQVYELRRGALVGRAELQWRPDGDAYAAQLSATFGEQRWLEWKSQGGFDAAGIAPLRFTDQRRARAALAANFQRPAGAVGATISYSGPAVRHALPHGGQDRLSWIVQLSAIAQARGAALSSGASITMFVSGARGDADVWVFTVTGTEPIESAGGNVEAIKLEREPRGLYDTRAEIWLDPAREHLPARLRLSTTRGDALEFVLQQISISRP